jgi:hypothetical protein
MFSTHFVPRPPIRISRARPLTYGATAVLTVGTEIVEWPKCAPPIDEPAYLTIDQAVWNPDSLSLYPASKAAPSLSPSYLLASLTRQLAAQLTWYNHAALRVTELNSNFGWINGVTLNRDEAQRTRAEGRGPQGMFGYRMQGLRSSCAMVMFRDKIQRHLRAMYKRSEADFKAYFSA